MTEIAPMPCGGRIAVDTPGYRPCDDCQGLRALCGATPCPKADEFQSVPLREVLPKNMNSGFARHPNCPTFPVKYPDDDPSDPRPPGKSSDPAVQRWLYRRRKKAAGMAVRSNKDDVPATEPAEAIPAVDPAPEPAIAPQERAEIIVPLHESPDPCASCTRTCYCENCEHGAATTMTVAEAAAILEAPFVDVSASCRIEDLLREVLAELRRPKVLRLAVCDGGIFLEEVPPCP